MIFNVFSDRAGKIRKNKYLFNSVSKKMEIRCNVLRSLQIKLSYCSLVKLIRMGDVCFVGTSCVVNSSS